MFLILYLFGALAQAQLLPGTAITATPCRAETAAPCWFRTPELKRFAAVDSARQPILQASIRLAWDQDGLLLKIDEIPQNSWVEFSALPVDSRSSLPHSQAVTGTEGILRLPLKQTATGTEWKLQVQLVHQGTDGLHSFPWAPAGHGRHDYPPVLLLVENQAPKFDFEVKQTGSTLEIHAPAADQITLTHDRTGEPTGSRSPNPWSVTGRDQVSVEPTMTGWHHVEARWKNERGVLIDIQRKEIWLEGHTSPALMTHDIHPTPKWIQKQKGRKFTLHPDAKICAPSRWKAPAELLKAELARFTGHDLQIVFDQPEKCDIGLEVWNPNSPQLPVDGQTHLSRPEAFGLDIQRQGSRVFASDLQGAVYGAMALADAIGPDGSSPPLKASDSASLHTRVIHWNINTRATPNWSLDDAQAFVRRVLTRGRINFLIINPKDSLQYESHPEIAHGNALTREELQTLIRTARSLGIEVVPGLNSPGHSDWLTKHHPELTEDVNTKHLCTRHPDTQPLLKDIMNELLVVFDEPYWMHIGHDEAQWRSGRWFADERCPRCAGTSRSQLFAEDLQWQVQWLTKRKVRPIVWSDMLLQGWNGGREGTHRSLSLLTPSEREQLMVFAWSPLGDPIQNLAKNGIETMRVHTGYLDWKRTNLNEELAHLQGEGLGLFTPTPWHAAGPSAGSRPLHYLWPNVLLAGTTAWNSDLSNTPISTILNDTIHLPAYLPGWSHVPHSSSIPLSIRGMSPPSDLAPQQWDGDLTLSKLRYGHTRSVVAQVNQPIHIHVDRKVSGVSLIQATIPTHAATAIIRTNQRKKKSEPVARVRFVYEDGTQIDRPLQYGVHTYRPDGDLRSRSLWATAGVIPVRSGILGPNVTFTDHHLYRLDLPSPHPEKTLSHIKIHCEIDKVWFLVAAAASME